MKRVLFIIYTHSLGGGAERILTNVVNSLNPDKYDVDILEYAQYDVKEEPLHETVHRLPPIVSMKQDGKLKRLFKNIQVFSFSHFLKRRDKQYDIEISFNYQIPTFLLSGKTPAVSWIHGDVYDLKTRPYFRYLQRRAFRKVDRIVAISESTRKSLMEVFPEFADKIILIYNGFDTENILSLSRETCNIQLKKPNLVFVGRLDDNKSPLRLLTVIEMLKKDNIDVNVYFVGQGELETAIQETAEELHIQDRVFLLGYQTNPYPIMAQADAICMMSKSEGFPTVFAEGMQLGIPFISTPVGGVAELADDGKCGYVVESEAACATAVKDLLFTAGRREEMCANCLEHIQNFGLQRQNEKIENLIDSLLE